MFGHILGVLLIVSDAIAADTIEQTLWSVSITIQPVEALPDQCAGAWQRQADLVWLDVHGGDQLATGSYRNEAQDLLLIHPSGDSVAASFAGLPALPQADGELRARHGQSLTALDPWSLIIASWRLMDQEAWPWLSLSGGFTSLPWLCEHVTVDPWTFDAQQGTYVTSSGAKITVVPSDQASHDLLNDHQQARSHLAFGDLLTAVTNRDHALVMILVGDRGVAGQLDPSDVVLTAQHADGTLARQVRLVALGALLEAGASEELHAYRRDLNRRQKLVRHLPDDDAAPRTLYGLLVSLPRSRQWMVVAALGIGSLLMLRAIRRYRKRR